METVESVETAMLLLYILMESVGNCQMLIKNIGLVVLIKKVVNFFCVAGSKIP